MLLLKLMMKPTRVKLLRLFFAILFANITFAKAQVVAVVVINAFNEPCANIAIRLIPANKAQEEWIVLTDSMGKRRILAHTGDTIQAFANLLSYQQHLVKEQQTSDTIKLLSATCDLSQNSPIDPSVPFLPKIQKTEFDKKEGIELLYFLGQHLAYKPAANLTNEQMWLAYWYGLKNDIDDGGILQYYQNLHVNSQRLTLLETLLVSASRLPNSHHFKQTMLYSYLMHAKYWGRIVEFNKAHNNFWTDHFTQQLAELAGTEQEMKAALTQFELVLAATIKRNPERFCILE
jgi:hypothetical protein